MTWYGKRGRGQKSWILRRHSLWTLREPSQITFDFFAISPCTYSPNLHFLRSKFSIFLTTYPPLNANVICKGSLMVLMFISHQCLFCLFILPIQRHYHRFKLMKDSNSNRIKNMKWTVKISVTSRMKDYFFKSRLFTFKLWSTCFRSFFGGNWRHQNDISKLSDL